MVGRIERHKEELVPFIRQLGWKPGAADDAPVRTDRLFIKHGDLPPPAMTSHLVSPQLDRVLVCGLQADTCVMAAGFALFTRACAPRSFLG